MSTALLDYDVRTFINQIETIKSYSQGTIATAISLSQLDGVLMSSHHVNTYDESHSTYLLR